MVEFPVEREDLRSDFRLRVEIQRLDQEEMKAETTSARGVAPKTGNG